MTDPNGVVTAYSHDPLGRMISANVKHPSNAALDAITSFAYDMEGRVTGITSPQTATLFVDYSSIGRVTALRSGDGERIDFAYDRIGYARLR
jgi:YD repeat-containing protein